jgi:hypothetical protein
MNRIIRFPWLDCFGLLALVMTFVLASAAQSASTRRPTRIVYEPYAQTVCSA